MCGACEVARVYDCIVWCINFFISVQSAVLQDVDCGLQTKNAWIVLLLFLVTRRVFRRQMCVLF